MRRAGRMFPWATLTFFALASFARADLYLQSFQAPRHDRFYSGSDKAFIGGDLNFSGVGKTSNDGRWVTMISPSYFLTAAHWPAWTGASVTFYPNNTVNNPLTYTVASTHYITQFDGYDSDLYLGKLTTPIDTLKIAHYPIFSLDSFDEYLGKEIDVVGTGSASPSRRADRVGRNLIDLIGVAPEENDQHQVVKKTVAMQFDYDIPGLGADETFLISGDSGGPSFVVQDGALALVGIHYYNSLDSQHPFPPQDGYYSGDSFVPFYIDQLNANMGTEHVTIVVPEPGALWLLFTGGVTAWFLCLIRCTRLCALAHSAYGQPEGSGTGCLTYM
jgi:hypothetical protein